MKMRLLKGLFLLAFFCIGCLVATSTDLQIVQKDGSTKSTSISNISKITFSDGSINCALKNGGTENMLISLISKITFSNNASVSTNFGDTRLSIYPNPTTDVITVSGISNPSTFEIYSLSGAFILRQTVEASSSVDVSSLSPGIYFGKINGHTFKIIKQ